MYPFYVSTTTPDIKAFAFKRILLHFVIRCGHNFCQEKLSELYPVLQMTSFIRVVELFYLGESIENLVQ